MNKDGILCMVLQSSPGLIEILRATLEKLEQSNESGQNDSALRELKASILRAIAELEVHKSAA